jgi:hypothetical protein
MALETELKFFKENHDKWKKSYTGKFALVKGGELIGVYDSPDKAYDEGAKRFGTASFLVRQIGVADSDVQIPALTLGLINARLA